MKVIHAIHQGHELYGSDRTFLQSLRALRSEYPSAQLTAILPREGPLSSALKAEGFNVKFYKLWILRKSYGFGIFLRLLELPQALFHAYRILSKSDLVYINTAVVADYLLVARLDSKKVVAHIHEIPTGLARRVLAQLVRSSHAALLFNSRATSSAFPSAPDRFRTVVHNGVPGPAQAEPPRFAAGDRLRVLMLGRINDWKGQDLLVEALHLIPPDVRTNMDVRVVGDAFGDQPHRVDLEAQIVRLGLADQIALEGFVADPTPHLVWADVVVVPSRKPEPFGLVAIEAMAHARPVLAAAHGGLMEIVEHGRTGLLFEPNNVKALSTALMSLVSDPLRCAEMGAAGRKTFEARFTDKAFERNFTAALVLATTK